MSARPKTRNKKKQEELVALSSINQKTERLGLALKEEEMHALIECKDQSLKKYKRVEFGESILQSLIYTFCDSQYISQQNYQESLGKLQDIFYEFKNAAMDRMTDDEVLISMKEQFEGVCAGAFEYLQGICMTVFTDIVKKFLNYIVEKKQGTAKLHEMIHVLQCPVLCRYL